MSDKKPETGNKLCNFAPDEKDAAREDAILYRKPRSIKELNESSDRCIKHVSEHLDQIEEEIMGGPVSKKTE